MDAGSLQNLMDPDTARDKIWSTHKKAFHFLIWFGLVNFPSACIKCGADWNAYGKKVLSEMHCFKPKKPAFVVISDDEDDDEDNDEDEGSDSDKPDTMPTADICNGHMHWRQEGTIQSYLASNLGVTKFIKGIYWFAQNVPFAEALHNTVIRRKALKYFYYIIRLIIFHTMCTISDNIRLGGQGKAVCIDETFFTSRKISSGGFMGRLSVGQKTVVLGMVEIDLLTHKETGNVVLTVIKRRNRQFIEKAIRKHVIRGSLIITDKFQGYAFLSSPRSGFVHRRINHKLREFSKIEMIFGVPVNVTTNPAEALFGRVKPFYKHCRSSKIGPKSYGLYLSEWLFKQKFVGTNANGSWRVRAFWAI